MGRAWCPTCTTSFSLKGYITGAELVNSLISQCSWFIHVMPAIATLRANARRVTELAEAIENVQRPQEFYSLTGRSDFRYGRQNPVFGLTVQQSRTDPSGRRRHALPDAPRICASGAANGPS